MTIKITERTIGMWFVLLNKDSDWLCSLWATDETYELAYRFRYYVDDKTFDSKDKKNWYSAAASKDKITEDEAIAAIRKVERHLWVASGGKRFEIMMGPGGADEFIAEVQKLPFVTAKTIPLNKESSNEEA